MKVGIIGAGISGLTVGQILSLNHKVIIFEKESIPGGLIRCKRVNGSLFHLCGGHVFNSKRQDVLDWFWSKFEKEEFTKTDRHSVILMENGDMIPYPIENHVYLFDQDIQRKIIDDLLSLLKTEEMHQHNFEEFLKARFGNTMYDLYFQPYNEKVWRTDLKSVPLSWLEGKLPMPTVNDIIFNNMNHIKEKSFVHSTFWYEKNNGSQFIADRMSEGLDIRYNNTIQCLKKDGGKWYIEGESFEKIVFCGNIKELVTMIVGVDVHDFEERINALDYHGTTAVFCEIDSNPYSWIYQPSRQHESHRIICTGNFSQSNNQNTPVGRTTATIEFTDEISKEVILENLKRIPFHPQYLTHHYSPYTYPIQNEKTKSLIRELKNRLEPEGLYFTGRFAEWEYYNMDAAIGAAMDMCKTIQ